MQVNVNPETPRKKDLQTLDDDVIENVEKKQKEKKKHKEKKKKKKKNKRGKKDSENEEYQPEKIPSPSLDKTIELEINVFNSSKQHSR